MGNKGLQRATPSGTPLREAGSSGGTTGEGEHDNAGKQGAQIPPCFTCGSNGCGCALEHGMTDGSSVNARETQLESMGSWSLGNLINWVGESFFTEDGHSFLYPKAMKLWKPGRRRIEVSNLIGSVYPHFVNMPFRRTGCRTDGGTVHSVVPLGFSQPISIRGLWTPIRT